jgi:hypothetical protein
MIHGNELTARMTEAENITYFQNIYIRTQEALEAARDGNIGPSDPINYHELQKRLEVCQSRLSPLYRSNVGGPYMRTLGKMGESGFNQILARDVSREADAGLMLDIAQAILQHGEGYNKKMTDAYQEVVSDLYDGFLSAADRNGIKSPDFEVIAPLVKWGDPESGPYTWPSDATSSLGVKTAIVSLPAANAQHGILAWATLGHETAGHDILHADNGLQEELGKCIRNALKNADVNDMLPNYWATRIDETASDVLGMLNMGPAAGISLVGYFRALNAAYGKEPILRNVGPESDPHPADGLRGYLAASVVRLLNFGKAGVWAEAIEGEVDKDLTVIKLGSNNVIIAADEAKRAADVVASCLVKTKVRSLDDHALGEIQNWNDSDEQIVRKIRASLRVSDPIPGLYGAETYAAHVVAAAIVEALQGNTGLSVLFERMISTLKIMHDKNPSWGPLYVKHPGNITLLRAYCS